MSKDKSDYRYSGRRPPETDTTASPRLSSDGTTTQELADASRFGAPPSPTTPSRDAESSTNVVSEISSSQNSASRQAAAAERSDEAEATRRSIRTAPGAFHVQPLRRRAADGSAIGEDENQTNLLVVEDDGQETATADGQSVDTSGAAVLPEVGPAVVVDAHVEAVAVQVDEAVATYQAVPVVDALTTSRIPEDGDALSYQLESGTSQSQSQSASLEEGGGGVNEHHMSFTSGISSITAARLNVPSTGAHTEQHHRSESTGTPPETFAPVTKKSDEDAKAKKCLIWGVAVLLLVAVALGLGLGLGLATPQDGSGTGVDSSSTSDPQFEEDTTVTADNGTGESNNQDKSLHRLVEMDILPQTLDASVEQVASSVSLGLLLPTKIPGTMSRSLFVGWDKDDGLVKIYRSEMVRSNESVSFGPFIESASISLSDSNGNQVTDGEQDGSGQETKGTLSSRPNHIVVDAGVDGESFAVSFRNCVRFYTSENHEAQRKTIMDKEGFDSSLLKPVPTDKENPVGNATGAESIQWYQRGQAIVSDDDPTIQGFGSSIGYSTSGPHLFRRVVVGSDSGHVRVYRYRWTNDTVPKWQRLDGGLLDPPTNTTGKAVVAMAGAGVRFAVGYPNLGKLSLYRFLDEYVIDEDFGMSHIELVDEVYSENGDGADMFGRSLSLDVFGNFIIVGAKGYARAYWLRATPSSVVGFELIPAGDSIAGGESDGDEFGAVVASGRVPFHNGGCVGCPFILDKQRIAISSPAYDDSRGRVVLYQYNEDEENWETLASPIEGYNEGDGVAQAVRLSPDMGSVAIASAFGEAKAFRVLAPR